MSSTSSKVVRKMSQMERLNPSTWTSTERSKVANRSWYPTGQLFTSLNSQTESRMVGYRSGPKGAVTPLSVSQERRFRRRIRELVG